MRMGDVRSGNISSRNGIHNVGVKLVKVVHRGARLSYWNTPVSVPFQAKKRITEPICSPRSVDITDPFRLI